MLDDPNQNPLGYVLGQSLRDIDAPCKAEGDSSNLGVHEISGFKQVDSTVHGTVKFSRADLVDSTYPVTEEVWVADSANAILRYRRTEEMPIAGQEGKVSTELQERVYYDIGVPNSVPEIS